MKKQLIALAVGGAFCGLAQADGGVTVYGSIDAGFMTASKAPNPTTANPNNTGSVTAFQDAQLSPSSYGIKGDEDLGGGLKASFNLLGGFNAGNGTHNTPGVYQTQVFGQKAKVGLGGSWGTVYAGMQLDPGFVASIATDPRGMTDSFSQLEYWIAATAGNNNGGNSGALSGGIFDQESISYTYEGNGLYVGLLYGFGGVAGSTSAGSIESIGANYTNSGFTVSGSYAHADKPNANVNTGTSSEIWQIGLGYATGPFAVRANYGEFKSGYNLAGQDNHDVKEWGIGADWKVGANTANIAFYDAKDDGLQGGGATGGKSITWALMDSYALSKRTNVYAQLAAVKVDQTGSGNSSFIELVYTPISGPVVGATSTVFGLGMRHTF